MPDSIFHFFARNPPSIAIAGGILVYVVGGGYAIFNPIGKEMMGWGENVTVLGIGLQMLYLYLKHR